MTVINEISERNIDGIPVEEFLNNHVYSFVLNTYCHVTLIPIIGHHRDVTWNISNLNVNVKVMLHLIIHGSNKPEYR